MTDRLSEVSDRLIAVAQLESVMTAMRGIAAANLHEVHTQLPSIRAYANTVGTAIGEVMALIPGQANGSVNNQADEAELIIVLSAEQGFAGTFNERIFDVLERYLRSSKEAAVVLLGNRGKSVAQGRNISVLEASTMATRVDGIPTLAIDLADRLYRRIEKGEFSRVSLLHAEHTRDTGKVSVSLRSLFPFDFSRFELPVHAVPPMLTHDPAVLAVRLAEEYVFAELCEALMLSHAAENEARIRAMVRARSNVMETQKRLRADYQQLRQDQITAEISELTIGRLAGTPFESI